MDKKAHYCVSIRKYRDINLIPTVAMVSHCFEPGRYLWNNVFLGQQTIYPINPP